MTTTEKGCTMRTTHNAQRTTHNLHACPNLGEKIHVALAVYDPSGNYSQHAGVTITSIFENTSSPVMIHLLHDDTLTQDNREKFIRTTQKYSQEINFHDMTNYRDKLTNEMKAIAGGRFTVGTLYRMFIPQALADVDKVIYLDCDVLVNLDIKELWDIDITKKSLAGALDTEAFGVNVWKGKGLARAVKFKIWGSSYKTYINGGVLYMNLKKIRERGNLFELVKNWCERYGHLVSNADQDVLNAIFYGDIEIVDGKFNRYNLGGDISNSILHTWTHKPWSGFLGANSDILYWKMYFRSAWGENKTSADDVIAILAGMTKITQGWGRHNSNWDCIKSIFAHYQRKIMYRIIPTRAIAVIFSELYHRIKYKFSHRH